VMLCMAPKKIIDQNKEARSLMLKLYSVTLIAVTHVGGKRPNTHVLPTTISAGSLEEAVTYGKTQAKIIFPPVDGYSLHDALVVEVPDGMIDLYIAQRKVNSEDEVIEIPTVFLDDE
jgi:hypothetical protein